MSDGPRFGFYGDDFTGSVDALLQFRRAGLAGVLVTEPAAPLPEDPPDVVGFAGVARSLERDELDAEVRPAFERLRELGVMVAQYKACSTADSSPRIGSLGRVAELACEVLGPQIVPAAFAQPDFGRYTSFGHHFAREGDTVYRLDRQPTMSRHPVTPMAESDLRVHLAEQTDLPVAGLDWTSYADPAAVRAALAEIAQTALPAPNEGPIARPGRTEALHVGLLVADALSDEHLDALAAGILALAEAEHARTPRVVIGSGGISGALGRVAGPPIGRAPLPPLPETADPADGPVLAIVGSTSARTAEQVLASGWIVFDALDPATPERARAELNAGANVVVTSLAGLHSPTAVPGVRPSASIPRAEVERALIAAGDLALRGADPARLIVCGGDTSGVILRGLGVQGIEILARPWGNAPLLRVSGSVPALRAGREVVLKGGQVGHRELFADVASGRALSP